MLRAVLFRAALAFAVSIATLAPSSADTTPATLAVPYASVLRTINPRLALWQSTAYAQALLAAARRFHVDPNLVIALVTVESSWRPHVSSIHGAEGLGQLKPGTARELGVDPWSGRDNLRGTALYLHRLLGTFHGGRDPVREALAGYNAGPYAVVAAGGHAPNSVSRHYVIKVMRALAMVRARVAALVPAGDAALGADAGDAELADDAELGIAPTSAQLDGVIRAIDRSDALYWGAGR